VMNKLNQHFKTAYFDFNRYTLRPDATNGPNQECRLNFVTRWHRDPTLMLRVEGHCDERGSFSL